MHRMIFTLIVLRKIMDLGMTVVARSNAIIGAGRNDLIKFHLSVLVSGIRIARLQIPAAAPATVIVGLVGVHLNKVFLPHHGLHNKAQILGHRIPKAFAHDLTRILNRKLDLQVFVPV